jgi:hypothetical protein
MDQPLYDIYFTGELVEGIDANTAKTNLANLFKTSPESVAKLFNGKPQALKRGVDKTEALKYKTALHKAGLLVAFKAHQTTSTSESVENHSSTQHQDSYSETSASVATANHRNETADWSIAAVGSNLLNDNERASVKAIAIDTSNIKLVSVFSNPEPEPKAVPPAPNTSHLTLAAAGENLLVDKPPVPAPTLNLDNLSLAPPGTELEQLHNDIAPLNPDISALSLAAAGTDILEGQVKKTPPPPPNTEHLSVVDNESTQ